MQLLSYDMARREYAITTITRFETVVTYNQMVISTSTSKPLIVDQNPAQKLYAMLPDGTVALVSVTDLRMGYKLFQPLSQTWVSISNIRYQNNASIQCTTFTLQHPETILQTATWIHSKTGHTSDFPHKTPSFRMLLYSG